ncbi:MAG: aminodeoxychorismate/anthranilate synthase component II [Phycisphaeraceae bacterium]|nr:aminodeoxychorismate/anthranilate synthase component II [Phycisphaeraceae bacterium]MCW5753142.1 aminodeoxychorismate/anthranilate synthase component II [Phycisphaeraceae bacterium]
MILIIDNYDSFTWNLVQRIGELDPSLTPGEGVWVVRNDEITPEQAEALDSGRGPSHLIISPGPCTPREAGISSEMIRRFAGRIPVLGVCLGHQCIGELDGMNVVRHVMPVHGKTSLVHHDGKGIFRGIENPMRAARYHSLVIAAESVLPVPRGHDDWTISAWAHDQAPDGSIVRVVMGLRRVWADPSRAPLDGVQFHPESFMTEHGPRLLANFLRGAG